MRLPTLLVVPVLASGLAGLSACSTPRTPQSEITAPVETADRTQVFAVDGMTCATCPIAVKNAMASVTGVKSVSVDFDRKRATVVFDAARATPAVIARAASDAGFPTTPIP